MGFLKAIIIIAITMALSLTITMKTIITQDEAEPTSIHRDSSSSLIFHEKNKLLPSKRVSRLLAQNPNAPIHCHKDDEICDVFGAKNATCCNNKCLYLAYDKHNCGACKKKCKYTQTCCRGECVDTDYDKRHCGECNNRCKKGEYCVYGMCNYA
ncbi:stigma-specific STIG1-like protein 3 [Cicer arietinum]|uniref:Stigma-specific STIG1-like protein 3 n=1 Tax=Cicer arietinum TaxID=3827 RepID=A0A1S2Z2J8_CICAR|nr:stigma-specific STIG1-like protein 3 [Cicer arietinum]